MTVECSRARWSASSVLRVMICGFFAVIGLVTGGCGSTTYIYGTPVITVSSVSGPFSSYFVYVDNLTLVRSDGLNVEPIAVQEEVDFTQLTDLSEIYGAPAVPEGTYTQAAITVDYTNAQISVIGPDGQPQDATVVNAAGDAVGAVTYYMVFDKDHQLVLTNGQSTPFDLNFDLSASTIVNNTVAPPRVTVSPFVTVNTVPTYTKPLRSRGVFVEANTAAGNFIMNARPFHDQTSALGAITVQTTAQTTYNVNGVPYSGSAGLAAIAALPVNTILAAYGSLGSLSSITPVFNATQIYAGLSLENLSEDRVTGTVLARQGNTITIHGATIYTPYGSTQTALGPLLFLSNLNMTVSEATNVSIDGQPDAAGLGPQSISIGQEINAGGTLQFDSAGAPTYLDATAGLVRMTSTTLWGTLNAGATAGTASLDVVTLGDYAPYPYTSTSSPFDFTGTGSSASLNANPANYSVNTGSVDESATPTGTALRLDGIVSPYGSAPPDFIASAVTPATATEQELVVDWVSPGTVSPFLSIGGAGLVVNMNSEFRDEGYVKSGPTGVSLTSPLVNVTIVPDTTVTNVFAYGSTVGGLALYNSFDGFVTGVTSYLAGGTNPIGKLVAVGHYDATSETFTAYRIDLEHE